VDEDGSGAREDIVGVYTSDFEVIGGKSFLVISCTNDADLAAGRFEEPIPT
jgi:hypothetical protein